MKYKYLNRLHLTNTLNGLSECQKAAFDSYASSMIKDAEHHVDRIAVCPETFASELHEDYSLLMCISGLENRIPTLIHSAIAYVYSKNWDWLQDFIEPEEIPSWLTI